MTFNACSGIRRTVGRRAPLMMAGAALLLSACVVPVPGELAGERSSSMLATNATCPASATLDQRFAQAVDPAQIDQSLLSEALRQLANIERCRRGAEPLGLSPAAVQAAGSHARSMAQHDFMGHVSPVRGRETLEQRVAAETGQYGYLAENVARAPVSALDAEACLASARSTSYAGLAQSLFGMWITSQKHSDNILNPRYRQVGAGIGVNPAKYRCGEIAAAMVFIG